MFLILCNFVVYHHSNKIIVIILPVQLAAIIVHMTEFEQLRKFAPGHVATISTSISHCNLCQQQAELFEFTFSGQHMFSSPQCCTKYVCRQCLTKMPYVDMAFRVHHCIIKFVEPPKSVMVPRTSGGKTAGKFGLHPVFFTTECIAIPLSFRSDDETLEKTVDLKALCNANPDLTLEVYASLPDKQEGCVESETHDAFVRMRDQYVATIKALVQGLPVTFQES